MNEDKLDIQVQTTGIDKSIQQFERLAKTIEKVAIQVEKLSKNFTKLLRSTTRSANAMSKIGTTKSISGEKSKNSQNQFEGLLKSNVKYNKSIISTSNATRTVIQSTVKSMEKLEKATKTTNRHISNFSKKLWNLGRTLIIARRLGSFIGQIVNESGAWIENLNLFAVTFGDNYQETLDWAITLSDKLGVANNEIVKMTGLFKQLSTSIGIADNVGDSLSQTLTQLAYDFTSFYNLQNVEESAQKLQAGIFSGQIRTLRSLGIDVSQESIDNLLKTNDALNNFNISANQLTQSQKVLARVLLTLEAGSNAFGDIGRSIDTLQNRIRVFRGSLDNLRLALGDAFSGVASKFMATATGMIQAVTSVIRVFIPLKNELSYEIKDNTFTQIKEDAEDAEATIGQLSFDKFESLTSGENENLTITQALTEELQRQQEEYNAIFEQNMRIDKLVQSIKEKVLGWIFPDKTIEQIQTIISGLGSGATLGDKLNAVLGEMNPTLQAIVNTARNFYDLFKTLSPVLLKVANIILDIVSGIVKILDKTKLLYPAILAIISLNLVSKFKKIIGYTGSLTKGLGSVISSFSNIGKNRQAVNWIASTNKALNALDGGTRTTSKGFINLQREFVKTQEIGGTTVKVLDGMKVATTALNSVMSAIMAYQLADSFFGQFQKEGKVIAGALGIVAAALMGVAAAAMAAVGALSWGTAIPMITAAIGIGVAGIKATVEGAKEIKGYATGGIPDKSELFYMNEQGIPEALINTGGSQTNVINQDQLRSLNKEGFKEAIYESGLLEAMRQSVVVEGKNIDNSAIARAIFPALKTESKRQGGNQL